MSEEKLLQNLGRDTTERIETIVQRYHSLPEDQKSAVIETLNLTAGRGRAAPRKKPRNITVKEEK